MEEKISNSKQHNNWLNVGKKTHTFKKNSFWSKVTDDVENNSRVFFAVSRRIEERLSEELIEEASTATAKPKNKIKKISKWLMLIFNIALVVLVFLNFAKEQGGIQPLDTLLANSPMWRYLFIALGLFVLTILFNSFKFSILIANKTKVFRPIFSLKLASIGRYYDLITPLGSGGQPFEIMYLKKNGYSAETSTAIPLTKYMIWQISYCILSLFVLIAYSHNYISTPVILILAWVGLSVIILLFLFVFFMSVTKKWGASLVVSILKLLAKMKIIKNYRKTLRKVLNFVKSYQSTIKSFVKSPGTVVSSVVVTLGSIICNASIAYFVYRAFNGHGTVSWWTIVCTYQICELSVAIIPLPGGSGASELSFNALFGSLFGGGSLFWGILIWRILVYYLYIPVGWIVMLSDAFTRKKADKKPNLVDTKTNESVKI